MGPPVFSLTKKTMYLNNDIWVTIDIRKCFCKTSSDLCCEQTVVFKPKAVLNPFMYMHHVIMKVSVCLLHAYHLIEKGGFFFLTKHKMVARVLIISPMINLLLCLGG